MNQTPPSRDPEELSSEANIEQSVENTQGETNQQAIIGNDNNQTHSQNVEGGRHSTSQQAIAGNQNVQIQNVINLPAQDVFGKDASSEPAQRKALPDITEPLPQKPRSLPEVKLNELPSYYKVLQENSLIVITCSDPDTAFSAAYDLIENTPILSKRLFTRKCAPWEVVIEPSIYTIVNAEISKGESTIIIVDTSEMQPFLDSLIVTTSSAAIIKQDLINRQRFCICLAKSQTLETALERREMKLLFPRWEIPFEEEDEQYLQKDDLGRVIDSPQDKKSALLLYGESDTLKKIVLYIATFFENLSVNDFDRVVSLLLADQIDFSGEKNKAEAQLNSESTVLVTISDGDQVLTVSKPQKGQSNEISNVSKGQTKNILRDIWEEDADKILESCFLEYSDSGIVGFSLPNLRDELTDYFKRKKFIEHKKNFRKLIELNLLFDKSPQVAKALRSLSVSMMLFQLGLESWVDWLEQTLIKALESNLKSKDREYIYYCIADLLRETLDHDSLEGFVGKFLERLISLRRHDVVLSLSKRLRFAPQFDEYYWFKQSIDRGDNDAREEAYQILYNQLVQSGSRVYETLERVNAWLPNLERNQKYSLSNKCALQLLLQYLMETLDKFDEKFYGDKVFSYSLFGGLRTDESIDSRLNIVVAWLLHPGMNSILDEELDEELGIDSLSIVSILIFPSLFNILFGFKGEVSIKSEFSRITSSSLQAINNTARTYEKITDIHYREIILRHWRNLSIYLLEESNRKIREEKKFDEGYILGCKRNVINYLIENF